MEIKVCATPVRKGNGLQEKELVLILQFNFYISKQIEILLRGFNCWRYPKKVSEISLKRRQVPYIF